MREPEIREEDGQNAADASNEKLRRAIARLVALVPASDEPQSPDPAARAKEIVRAASWKAATISGALTLPMGPLGLLTVLPDLMAIWNIQRKMVADVAAAFGKTAQLGPKQMLYCLFKHTTSQAFKGFVVWTGSRILFKQTTRAAFKELMQKIGVRVANRVTAKALSRWLPLVGTVGVAGYAYYDTAQVGKTTMTLLQTDFDDEDLLREDMCFSG
jgi:hypothetical protein